MVLISVNTVMSLLKRSTCVRGRTHLAVVAICRFEAEPLAKVLASALACDVDGSTSFPFWQQCAKQLKSYRSYHIVLLQGWDETTVTKMSYRLIATEKLTDINFPPAFRLFTDYVVKAFEFFLPKLSVSCSNSSAFFIHSVNNSHKLSLKHTVLWTARSIFFGKSQ